jgi:hypothetical protein
MIRNDDDWPGRWDARAIGIVHVQANPHFREKAFEAKSLRRTLHASIETSHPADWTEFAGHSWKMGNFREYFALRLTRV